MWNTSINFDYIVTILIEAIENYSINNTSSQFDKVVNELKKHFTECSDEKIIDIISLCLMVYSSRQIEHVDLVLTAPDSFRVNSLRTRETLYRLIENANKSITITGYSISDYFSDMLDLIIRKSQQGVYVRFYINNVNSQNDFINKLFAYRSKFLKIYEYKKKNNDKMAALHAKIIVVDSKKSLVSSANLSYHGIKGNIEMGFLIESHDKAKQIENILREMIRMKLFYYIKK